MNFKTIFNIPIIIEHELSNQNFAKNGQESEINNYFIT